MDVDGVNIVNIHKPSPVSPTQNATPVLPHLCLHEGDFNCQHTDWGYHSITPDGDCLADWAADSGLVLLHNPKDAHSFFSAAGTLEPIQIWHSRVPAIIAGICIDAPKKIS